MKQRTGPKTATRQMLARSSCHLTGRSSLILNVQHCSHFPRWQTGLRLLVLLDARSVHYLAHRQTGSGCSPWAWPAVSGAELVSTASFRACVGRGLAGQVWHLEQVGWQALAWEPWGRHSVDRREWVVVAVGLEGTWGGWESDPEDLRPSQSQHSSITQRGKRGRTYWEVMVGSEFITQDLAVDSGSSRG